MEELPQENNHSYQPQPQGNQPETTPQHSSGLDFQNRIDLSKIQKGVAEIRNQLGKVIVGQEEFIELLMVSIFANGHALIEGVPGVAKTITTKLIARTMDVGFSRIQFTPDLMPSDILGTSVFDIKKNEFDFKKGPVFSNIILIDEINRAPAKTQAALFEVMAERQITMDGVQYEMEHPFLVFATQNPVEQEGTYRLPEAQLDRFLFKIEVGYPSLDEEIAILDGNHLRKNEDPTELIGAIFSAKEIAEFQYIIQNVLVEPKLIRYIASIVHTTRNNPFLFLGASPRASISILNAAKAVAAIRGRDFVIPEDIKFVAIPALKHRIVVSPEKEMEGISSTQIINQIIESIEIPR
ncbi:AAA family ATPase [Moheibacter lacus]|uniref:MoxR family ATPase n=1 Tax=Moheibacter lacus TaxID=2745851 RepID=A0A838ZKR3_9FLAO|nr:MoxR family ATPase [Moheibacter lacus]MBA5628270.1 MoxR family ATPase [Moheibacter lacus]